MHSSEIISVNPDSAVLWLDDRRLPYRMSLEQQQSITPRPPSRTETYPLRLHARRLRMGQLLWDWVNKLIFELAYLDASDSVRLGSALNTLAIISILVFRPALNKYYCYHLHIHVIEAGALSQCSLISLVHLLIPE